MESLFIRNLIYTILQPGVIAGLIPYLVLSDNAKEVLDQPLELYQYVGGLIFVAGLIIMLICIGSFATQGKGTLSPADPTQELVVEGLYTYSRNPMYVGVALMLIGESMFFVSIVLWVYAICVVSTFHLFILYFEEPRLKRDFGEKYVSYCRRVKRWI
jgi:protein-S-isoprenylcysteine O-methyltransferase Ste14